MPVCRCRSTTCSSTSSAASRSPRPPGTCRSCIALASSLHGRALPDALVAFGEIGLTGEVRPVAYGDERLREAQKQGFRLAVVPQEQRAAQAAGPSCG